MFGARIEVAIRVRLVIAQDLPSKSGPENSSFYRNLNKQQKGSMKTRFFTNVCVLVSMAALNLAFSPAMRAQTPANPPPNPTAPDANQSTKSTDSTAEQNGGTTTQTSTGSMDKTASKNETNSLDMNPGTAQTSSPEKTATKTPSDATTEKSGMGAKSGMMTDKSFVMKAAQGGMLEVELGKVAADKASASNVKDFGSKMVTDHGMANDKLKAIAQAKGMTVPAELDSKHQATVDHLSKLSGTAFDKAYVTEMVKDHQHDAMLFQKEIDTTQDADLKSFATDTLTTVKMHLSMIKEIQAGMK
jgi:putative membrane protein